MSLIIKKSTASGATTVTIVFEAPDKLDLLTELDNLNSILQSAIAHNENVRQKLILASGGLKPVIGSVAES